MKRLFLSFPVWVSPVLLGIVLFETMSNEAYPSDGDSIGIPLFSYLIFFYPIALYLLSKVKARTLSQPKLKLWNSNRNIFSFFSLVLSIYPLGFLWVAFFLVAFSTKSYASIAICGYMILATLGVRTYAIQEQHPSEQ